MSGGRAKKPEQSGFFVFTKNAVDLIDIAIKYAPNKKQMGGM